MTTITTTAGPKESLLQLAGRLAARIGRTLKGSRVMYNRRKGYYEIDINGLFCRLLIWPEKNQFRTDGPVGLSEMHKINDDAD